MGTTVVPTKGELKAARQIATAYHNVLTRIGWDAPTPTEFEISRIAKIIAVNRN